MTLPTLIQLAIFAAGVLLAVYAFLYRMDKRVSALEGRCLMHQSTIDAIAGMNQKLDKVFNDNEVFWRVIGPKLEDIIHSPKSVDRDALVSKLTSGTIERDELVRHIELMHAAIGGDEWSSEKRFAGLLLLARATALFNDARYERRRTPR